MKKMHILPLAAALIGVAGIATAQASSQARIQRCKVLERQFDRAKPTRVSLAKLKQARVMRDVGGRLCTEGKTRDGAHKLETALRDLGLRPVSHHAGKAHQKAQPRAVHSVSDHAAAPTAAKTTGMPLNAKAAPPANAAKAKTSEKGKE